MTSRLRSPRFTRRSVLSTGTALAASLAMPSISRADDRPVFTHGVQSGDVTLNSGMIWTRTNVPARVMMEVSTTESFRNAVALPPVNALPDSDFAVKRLLEGLPAGQDIFYRFTAADLSDLNAVSEPMTGRFRTAPGGIRDIRFAWSGDTAGQGYGIDDEGMVTYSTIAKHQPDFFLHSGDTIYADGPMKDEVRAKDGTLLWTNTTLIDEKRKVAETLDEYRAQWKYNMMDRHVQELSAAVPTFYQWDDHEVVNNWSPSKVLDDRYTERNVALLAARAARAFHEMTPISYQPAEPGRVYRKISYGPLLDVFFLDMRTYRGPNTANLQEAASDETVFLGARQIEWLKREMSASTATWKVIAADMPIGLVVPDGEFFEAIANADDGPAKGREFELADILRFIKAAGIKNTVWLTADVHYTAAHYYNPDKAQMQDFDPFWEFVSGPLHAGTFGPNPLDMTFGPEVRYVKAPTAEQGVNLPPSMGLQFFGLVDIAADTRQMTVRLMDRADTELWSITLDPEFAA